jgi:hypothetical protein
MKGRNLRTLHAMRQASETQRSPQRHTDKGEACKFKSSRGLAVSYDKQIRRFGESYCLYFHGQAAQEQWTLFFECLTLKCYITEQLKLATPPL